MALAELPPRGARPEGRVPPHNLDAEESLLGAMLLSRDAIVAATEVGVGADDFYKPAHGHVFDAITSLYGAGEPADPVTVAEELRRANLLEAIGGPAILLSLQTSTPATSNAARYARIINELALLRRLIGVSSEIAEIGYSVPDDVLAAVDRAEAMVFDVAQRRVTDTMSPIKELLDASLTRLEMLYEKGDSITGLPTGYHGLDELLSGLQPSTLNIIGARPATGKALALDTPIPTPSGWTTMGELEVGDEVFDEAGRPCRVLYTSPIFTDHRCFEVRFDDGTCIVADAGHRWLAYDLPAWKSHRSRMDHLAGGPPMNPRLARDQSARVKHPRVVTTQEMVEEGVRADGGRRPNWYLPLAALDLPDADLPVDPYVLGCWLGDGSSSGASLTLGLDDAPHFVEEFERAGYVLDHRPGHDPLCWGTSPVPGAGAWQSYTGDRRVLARELQSVGLLRRARKHVPAIYLRGSFKQRLALLQGVMDTDGTVSRSGRGVELCLANRELLEQVWELVASLGHKPNQIFEKQIPLADGRTAVAWRFRWTPRDPVFRLARKASLLADVVSTRRNGRATRRAIAAIVEVPTVPTRCISVDSPGHLFLASRAMIPTHNTAMALGMASHAALEVRRPVLLFSLEMSHLELTQRILSAEARVDSTRMRNGKLAESDWTKLSHAIGRLAEAPLYIDDNPQATVMEIRAKARRLKSRLGDLGLIVIDYLQLMTGRTRAENRQVEVSEISRGLKILARELEVPVVALSQLSRQLELRADKRPMLADLRESGCMPASTRLMRADTGEEVTLGELVLTQEEPLVWSLDERWRLVPRRLVKAFPSGIKPVFRLRLASGREVDATANHPFRTIDGWTRLDELAVGTAIAVPRRIPSPVHGTPAWDEDELVLLAHLLGDGSMGPNSVKYATADPANKAVVEEAARRRFGIEARAELRGRTWQVWLPSPYRLTHNRHHPVRNWLEPLGLWGVRSHDKFIPENVFGLGDEQVRQFLHHLWATDGSITIGRNRRGRFVTAYYATTSRRLADGVRRLLLRLDVQTRVRRARKAGYRDSWHVAINGAEHLERFLSLVGANGERGEIVDDALAIVRALKPNPNVDLVPWSVAERVKLALQERGMTHRELAAGLGEGYPGAYLLGTADRPRRFSRRRLERIAALTGDGGLHDLATSDVLWDEIVEIVALGPMPTFDATVDDTHNFVADGVIAHNSLEQDADVVMFLYRDELYNPESPDRGTCEVLVAKHRSGPTGMDRLAFLDHYTRFANMARNV
jgi:replicative DNA helicase